MQDLPVVRTTKISIARSFCHRYPVAQRSKGERFRSPQVKYSIPTIQLITPSLEAAFEDNVTCSLRIGHPSSLRQMLQDVGVGALFIGV